MRHIYIRLTTEPRSRVFELTYDEKSRRYYIPMAALSMLATESVESSWVK